MLLGTGSRWQDKPITPPLILNNKQLAVTNRHKYLGVLLNSNLSFSDQIQQVIGNVTRKLNSLSFLHRYISQKTAVTIYKGTILPLLEYANVTHTLVLPTLLRKLQRLQNCALWIIYWHRSNSSLAEFVLLANLGTLAQRSNRQLLCLMFRRAHFSEHYPTVVSSGSIRTGNKIKFPVPTLSLLRRRTIMTSLKWRSQKNWFGKHPSILTNLVRPRLAWPPSHRLHCNSRLLIYVCHSVHVDLIRYHNAFISFWIDCPISLFQWCSVL